MNLLQPKQLKDFKTFLTYAKGTKATKTEKPAKKSTINFLCSRTDLKKIKKSLNLKSEEEDTCLPLSLINHNQQKDFKTVQIALRLKKLKLEKAEFAPKKAKK